MKRVIGVCLGLAGVLGLIWFCWGNVLPALTAQSENQPPKFYPATAVPTQQTPEATKPQLIAPYCHIYAQELIPFDGPYVENSRQAEQIGVAALVLCNTGEAVVEYVEAVVYQGQRRLHFTATFIPPGGKVLALETNAQLYTQDVITDFQYPTVLARMPQEWESRVSVTPGAFLTLTVKNLTDRKLSCVRVFYKQYYEKEDLYIGGITYSMVLTDLQGAEERTQSPYHYAADCTKVVAVAVEE